MALGERAIESESERESERMRRRAFNHQIATSTEWTALHLLSIGRQMLLLLLLLLLGLRSSKRWMHPRIQFSPLTAGNCHCRLDHRRRRRRLCRRQSSMCVCVCGWLDSSKLAFKEGALQNCCHSNLRIEARKYMHLNENWRQSKKTE